MKGIRKVYMGGEKGCGEVCHQYIEGLFDSHWGSLSLGNFYLYFFLQAFNRKSNKP